MTQISLEEAATKIIGIAHQAYDNPILDTAIEFNLFDILGDTGASVQQIGEQAKISQDGARRLSRSLVSLGYVSEFKQDHFINTSLGSFLCEDNPQSMKSVVKGVRYFTDFYRQCLKKSIQQGESAFSQIYGKDIMSMLKDDKEMRYCFDKYMQFSNHSVQVVKYDYKDIDEICDLGGGTGEHLFKIIEENQHLNGIVFDLEGSEKEALKHIQQSQFKDKVKFVSGNFFTEVPQFKNYCIKNVLHDFNDDLCVQLMKNIRRSIQGGKLFIYGFIQNDLNKLHWVDLAMMALNNGRERNVQEYEQLAQQTGFKVVDHLCETNPMSLGVVVLEPQ